MQNISNDAANVVFPPLTINIEAAENAVNAFPLEAQVENLLARIQLKELLLEKYEQRERIAKIISLVGKILTIVGGSAAVLFFGAPAIPAIISSVFIVVFAAMLGAHSGPDASLFIVGYYYAPKAIAEAMYSTPRIAIIGGIAFGSFIALGLSVYGIGKLGEKWYAKKIINITAEIANLQQELKILGQHNPLQVHLN